MTPNRRHTLDRLAGTPARHDLDVLIRSRRFRTALAAGGLVTAAGLGLAPPARASQWDMKTNFGIDFGVRFGTGIPTRFVLGLQSTTAYVDQTDSCGGNSQQYAGAVARVEFPALKEVSLSLGPVAGLTNGLFGYAGDVGVGYSWGLRPGVFGSIGVEVSGAFLLDARLATSTRQDGQLTGGLRGPPLSFSGGCAIGRPLRNDLGRAPLAGATHIGSGRAATEDEGAERVRAAALWLDRARLEWASVPAFLELACQLEACGAPATLITRARAAANDELNHAIVSGQLAVEVGGLHLVTLDPPSAAPPRAPATGTRGLVRLAVESFVDGCVTEAAAAEQAAREAVLAGTPAIARAQATIATDEARHAALAWDILAWTLAVDRAVIAPALRAVAPRLSPAPKDGGAARFGIMDDAHAFALRDQVHARATARLNATLG